MIAFRDVISLARLGSTLMVPVVALHCSGADARQWRPLAAALGSPFFLNTPEFYGCAGRPAWHGAHAFGLCDEARPILEAIDALGMRVHLIGHSYGGGVALHIARACPRMVASLTLYEPSAFHLLKAAGPPEAESFAEIRRVAQVCAEGVASGDYRGGACAFIEYWGGARTWAALRPSLQAALVAWLPKAPLDFHALIEEPAALDADRAIACPVLILRGEFAPAPTAAVARLLSSALPRCRIETIPGAGHMGPITHADEVNARILRFLQSHQLTFHPRPAAHRLAATQTL